MLVRLKILGMIVFILAFSAQGENASINSYIATLESRFDTEIDRAGRALDNSKVKGAAVYWLTYGTEAIETPADRIGKILKAYPLQQTRIENTIADANFTGPDRPDATNNLLFKIGFVALENRIANSCRSCKTPEEKQEFQRGAKDFMKIFDFQDQDLSPSALIFYDEIKKKFNDPVFVQRTLNFRDELNKIIQSYANDAVHIEEKTLFDVALKVCFGNKRDAVELTSLLLTRDVGSILYFEYIRAHSPEFVKAVGEVAINVRLISELDQHTRGINVDRFSYDGSFSSRNIKNYYFWSGAYVGQRLRDLGYKPNIVKELITSMPHQYKMFAAVQMKLRGMGMGKYPFIDEERFKADVYEVIRNSSVGNRFSGQPATQSMCSKFYGGRN